MEIVSTPTAQSNLARCMQENLCGLCKKRLGHEKTFMLEMPILILRATPQAPMHRECANELLSHPDLKDKLVVIWTCRGYEKIYTARPTRQLLLRPGIQGVEAFWWYNARPAVADEVLDALTDNTLSSVLLWADQFDMPLRQRVCLEARAMMQFIDEKLIPKLR